MKKTDKKYYVYIVECADGSFYTGYTTDIDRRINEHNFSSRSAKYTRSRRPVRLIYREEYDNLSAALKREYQIKKLTRSKKKQLIDNACKRKSNLL
jgi:putative endonuclease